MNLAHFPRFSVEVVREEIPIETMMGSKVPDEKWRHVDEQGHGHFWSGKELPTLEWVVTGKTWVGDEYDGSEVDVGEYRCRQCGAVVEPGYRIDYGPTRVPGPTHITVTIEHEAFHVNPDEYAQSVDAWASSLREIVESR